MPPGEPLWVGGWEEDICLLWGEINRFPELYIMEAVIFTPNKQLLRGRSNPRPYSPGCVCVGLGPVMPQAPYYTSPKLRLSARSTSAIRSGGRVPHLSVNRR